MFLSVSQRLLCAVLALTCCSLPAAEQQFYELRVYRNARPEKQQTVLNYAAAALVPALNRAGSNPVGIFTPQPKEDQSASGDVYVLIPFDGLDKLSALNGTLAADAEYQAAAADFLALSPKDPGYQRIESRLMKAFAGMPQLEIPSAESPERVLELRIYESHNEEKARLKVEMFNEGEIDIMKDVKLAPVFFGETLISNDVPNLTYMLSADNTDVHKQHFQDFLKHPEWDRMKKIEKYKGTVSRITSVILQPAACSQI